MKHFGIYESVEDAQDALNAGTLENDYVALVDGDLDYNSLSPEEPCYLGEWDDTNFTFTILDTDPSNWENGVTIGQLQGVYLAGSLEDLDIILTYSSINNEWHMELVNPNESDIPAFDFEEGMEYNWDTGVMVNPEESNSIMVYYDGDVTFDFNNEGTSLYPVNPECEEGPVE